MLVGFKAKNHPQQVVISGPVDDVDDRRTPASVFDKLHAKHRFTIDAAASAANALLPRYWTRADNALARPWARERLWCNPPYSDLRPWVEKATAAVDAPVIVMLVPANRCEQAWWQDLIEPVRDRPGSRLTTGFLRGRLRFERPGWTKPRKGDRPPFGLVLLTWADL